MQTIITKYLNPTNHNGARIKATSSNGVSMTRSYEYAMNAEENHEEVAMALAERLGLGCDFAAGDMPTGGYVFVPVDHSHLLNISKRIESREHNATLNVWNT
jgi:hypothetical protein